MSNSTEQRLQEVMLGFKDAMLVTRRGKNELRSRPMVIAGFSEESNLFFITSVDSAKLEELTEFPFVNVSLQDGKRFLSISGTARATRDPDKVDKLWSAEHRAWFRNGRDDPTLILLEIVPTYAEYWDRTGSEGLKFLLGEARALLTGEMPSESDRAHGKVDFSSPPRQESASKPSVRGA